MKATESAAESLVKTLRELPSKEALALRSEMATKVSSHHLQLHKSRKVLFNLNLFTKLSVKLLLFACAGCCSKTATCSA